MSRFISGLTYDVGTILGNYLLAQGFAVPVDATAPALVLPIQDDSELNGKDTPAEAEDRARRKRRKKR